LVYWWLWFGRLWVWRVFDMFVFLDFGLNRGFGSFAILCFSRICWFFGVFCVVTQGFVGLRCVFAVLLCCWWFLIFWVCSLVFVLGCVVISLRSNFCICEFSVL